MNSKDAIRRQVRRQAGEAGDAARRQAAQRILRRLELLDEFVRADAVALYWSLPGEVPTHEFAVRWSEHKRIYLPVMQGQTLVLRRFTGKDDLTEARFGIGEPTSGETIRYEELGLIVVPAVAFDRQGNRLGHGKGFYDRLLRRGGPHKAGICFDYQLFDSLPAEAHDVAMDLVVCGSENETGVYRCGNR